MSIQTFGSWPYLDKLPELTASTSMGDSTVESATSRAIVCSGLIVRMLLRALMLRRWSFGFGWWFCLRGWAWFSLVLQLYETKNKVRNPCLAAQTEVFEDPKHVCRAGNCMKRCETWSIYYLLCSYAYYIFTHFWITISKFWWYH